MQKQMENSTFGDYYDQQRPIRLGPRKSLSNHKSRSAHKNQYEPITQFQKIISQP